MSKFYFSLIDRYISSQLISPFLFSVGIFSLLGVSVGTFSDVADKIFEFDLSLNKALQIILFKLPEFIVYALPISLLLAGMMVYGRLSNDSEIIALRTCGISIYRLIIPSLAFSLFISGITFLFNELVVPPANYEAAKILVANTPEEKQFWQRNNIFYPEYEEISLPTGKSLILKSLFYAESFDGQEMQDLTVLTWSKKHLNKIIVSHKAQWLSPENKWEFLQGTIYPISSNHNYGNIQSFKTKLFSLSKAPLELAQQSRDPYEMNIRQALEYLKLIRFTGDEKRITMFEVRTQQKIAFPFICLIFGLFGSALGIRPQYTSRATSFGLSIGIVFSYYVLAFIVGALGLIGVFSPWLSAWLPNLIGLAIAIFLIKKASA